MKSAGVLFGASAMAGLCSAAPVSSTVPMGRPVRILSLSFKNEPLDVICNLIEKESAKGVDLVILPQTWRGRNDTNLGRRTTETLDGPTTTAMSALARKYNTYILSPIDNDNDRRLNSAVLLDRHGNVVFVYDQVFPSWSEFDHESKGNLGVSAPVYQSDFGRIGFAIGFDVNFPEVWKSLADQGAELVVWPSTYSGGTSLQAHALNNHYYIVTATGARDCVVYDITGEQVLYQKSKDINVAHITVDLDRGIYHENFNMAKRDKLLKEHGDDVEVEKVLDREAWFVLRTRRRGVSARALAHQYGLEELRSYIDRSRREIDAIRGWSFAERVDEGDQP